MYNFQDTVFIYEYLCSQISTSVAFNLFQPNVAFYIETSRNQSSDLQSKTNDWFLHERLHWAEMD